MKKVLFLLIAITFAGSINAQSYKYWIEFTDKKGSPYSISKPLAYLSPRAIYRRSKYHIPVKMNDLPPNPAYIDSILSKGAILYNRCRSGSCAKPAATYRSTRKFARRFLFWSFAKPLNWPARRRSQPRKFWAWTPPYCSPTSFSSPSPWASSWNSATRVGQPFTTPSDRRRT